MSTFSFGGTNLKKGASGDTVKKIQEALNASGNYNLSVDGIWGDETDAAIRDYQKNNGLSVDGIYGQNTHKALFGIAGGNTPSKPKEPESYSDIDLSKYDSGYQKSSEVIAADKKSEAVENALANLGDYTMSDTVIEAGQKKTDAENAVGSYGDFAYGNQNLYDDVINKIMNREKFSYDLNGDALYQQYKDKYIQQGKTAMQDTMGQAAAMTGGYGNSYAATAGNQAYQASLENLNNIVPELYQMAYDRYNQEGQDLLNQYAMLSDDRNAEYGMWSDGYNRLLGEREYYANGYYNAYNMDYSQYVDKYNRLNADRTYYADRADSAYAKDYGEWSDNRAYDSNQYWNETNFGYGQYRDSVADWENERAFQEAKSQFERQQALNEEQWEWQKNQAGGTGGSSSGSSGGGSGSGTGSGSGNGSGNSTGSSNGTGVNSAITKKASSFKTNSSLSSYLNGLVADGEITEDQAVELYAANKNSEADLKDRKWTQVDDGGINWFWGVDENAKVKDQYGNTYRLDDLVKALVKEGMSKKEAEAFVKKYN